MTEQQQANEERQRESEEAFQKAYRDWTMLSHLRGVLYYSEMVEENWAVIAREMGITKCYLQLKRYAEMK